MGVHFLLARMGAFVNVGRSGRFGMASTTVPDLTTRLKMDYYEIEGGLIVFTEGFHIRRGFCCGSRCRHCPYAPIAQKGNTELQEALETIYKQNLEPSRDGS